MINLCPSLVFTPTKQGKIGESETIWEWNITRDNLIRASQSQISVFSFSTLLLALFVSAIFK